ncbi:MAG: ribonuclease HI family protein [Patescibacteria group bacterium]|nr:ribonuclease HI family protein [Patescibacteria group bacterium]MDD5715174.1 ribonuclease HI family protein [Patescibacteria group bacterium]
MKHEKLEIFTDGGARGNPGPAGIGVVIWHGHSLVGTYAKYIGEATNNQAEYQAVLLALEQAKRIGARELDVYMDSDLAVNQLNRKFKIKDPVLGTLFVKAWNMMVGFKRVTFHHVPREKNHEADKLVNQAIDRRA